MAKIELEPKITLDEDDVILVMVHKDGTVAVHNIGYCLTMSSKQALELAETILNKSKEAPA